MDGWASVKRSVYNGAISTSEEDFSKSGGHGSTDELPLLRPE